MNPTDDELAQITAGSTSLVDIRRRVYDFAYHAGHVYGRDTTLAQEAYERNMERGVEFALLLQEPSAIAGTTVHLAETDYYSEHPDKALPHIVLSRRVYRDPWEKHVYYPPVPVA